MKLFYLSLGVVIIGFTLLVYFQTWFILTHLISPMDSSPMIFILALPLIWLVWIIVKKARIIPPLRNKLVESNGPLDERH
jgi:hypothetical protein